MRHTFLARATSLIPADILPAARYGRFTRSRRSRFANTRRSISVRPQPQASRLRYMWFPRIFSRPRPLHPTGQWHASRTRIDARLRKLEGAAGPRAEAGNGREAVGVRG